MPKPTPRSLEILEQDAQELLDHGEGTRGAARGQELINLCAEIRRLWLIEYAAKLWHEREDIFSANRLHRTILRGESNAETK